MRDNRRFQRGSGVFKCYSCGTPTRETGEEEAALGLCKRCLYRSYAENAANDYGEGSPEHLEWQRAFEALPKRG